MATITLTIVATCYNVGNKLLRSVNIGIVVVANKVLGVINHRVGNITLLRSSVP